MILNKLFHIAFGPIAFLLLFSCDGLEDMGNEETPKEIDTRYYKTIMPVVGDGSPHPQGGDCWGDLFFQFSSNNTLVKVYDLSAKALIQSISIPPSERGFVSNCHCNTVCFGSNYYDLNDEFPLLYVSTGYGVDGYTGALVYRITKGLEGFSLTLVQTLKFPKEKSSWTEFVPAGDYGYLCYTPDRIIYKVAMPKVSDGDTIVSKEISLETFQFTQQPSWMTPSRNQDRLFYKGTIIYITGVPDAGETSAFVILNLETLTRDGILNFYDIGLYKEPESIFSWRGDICVAFVDQIVKLKL